MSQQFASLKKGSVFLLGDAEENGITPIITDVYLSNEDTRSIKIGLAQQTADGEQVFAILAPTTAIYWTQRNADTGEVLTPPPILIASPPMPWPPGSPEPEPITEFFIGNFGSSGVRYDVTITRIDTPDATFRSFTPVAFSVTNR
jgi:hypothetical protein